VTAGRARGAEVVNLLLCPSRGAIATSPVSVCLSVCLTVRTLIPEPLLRTSPNFLCMLRMAVARSSSGGIAIGYVLPVMWIVDDVTFAHAARQREKAYR